MAFRLLIISLFALSALNSAAREKNLAKTKQSFDDLCENEDSSNNLKLGTKVRGIINQKSWGEIASRLPDNTGWKLSTGSKVLDKTYGKKWEIDSFVAEEEEPEALHDGDGNEIFGDHDKLWFKAEPPETDIKAYNLYTEIDQKKTISTDGYFDGKLALLYHAERAVSRA